MSTGIDVVFRHGHLQAMRPTDHESLEADIPPPAEWKLDGRSTNKNNLEGSMPEEQGWGIEPPDRKSSGRDSRSHVQSILSWQNRPFALAIWSWRFFGPYSTKPRLASEIVLSHEIHFGYLMHRVGYSSIPSESLYIYKHTARKLHVTARRVADSNWMQDGQHSNTFSCPVRFMNRNQ
jgi:hypothetical protein